MAEASLKAWRVDGPRTVRFTEMAPNEKPASSGEKAKDKALTAELAMEISHLQDLFHARREHKLLVLLQGTDTSGKDGTVRAAFRNVDPLGVRTVSYKAPVGPELDRDWLWRHHRDVPGRGEIVIFNRSHYEEVLVPVAHGRIDADEVARRFEHIRNFERLLTDTGTTILKVFLHISKDEQRERLQERIDDPTKHWKFDLKDVEERKLWDDYQAAYEALLSETGSEAAPWWVVPADSKTHRNLMVARLLRDVLKGLAGEGPQPNPALKGMVIT